MSDHYQHQQAVLAARAAVEEYRNRLAHAAEQAEQALAAIVNATGETQLIESARNALEMVASAKELTEQALQQATASDFELQRYQGGF